MCDDDIDSSIRQFSYIWSPGGFDMGYVQSAQTGLSETKGDGNGPQERFHLVNDPVGEPKNAK